VSELDRREKKLNEFEEQCKEWEKRLETKEGKETGSKEYPIYTFYFCPTITFFVSVS
jgi:hypothetical protein